MSRSAFPSYSQEALQPIVQGPQVSLTRQAQVAAILEA